MRKEKIIKQQARQALKGNISVLIAGFLAVAAAVILLDNLRWLVALPLGLLDPDTEVIVEGKAGAYAMLMTGIAVLAGILAPLCNGVLKAAANAVIEGKCVAADLLYFYRRPALFFKTMVVDLGLACWFALFTTPLTVLGREFFAEGTPAALWAVFTVIWNLLVYMILVHYPLAALALDDSRSIPHYLFGYIGFSFRHFGALFLLLFSMIGWIALGFFIVPLLYTAPYLAVALMNSARWLLALNKN